ncbi:hypothetical protein B296_00036535, partial [Ensete ventricosum]
NRNRGPSRMRSAKPTRYHDDQETEESIVGTHSCLSGTTLERPRAISIVIDNTAQTLT